MATVLGAVVPGHRGRRLRQTEPEALALSANEPQGAIHSTQPKMRRIPTMPSKPTHCNKSADQRCRQATP